MFEREGNLDSYANTIAGSNGYVCVIFWLRWELSPNPNVVRTLTDSNSDPKLVEEENKL